MRRTRTKRRIWVRYRKTMNGITEYEAFKEKRW